MHVLITPAVQKNLSHATVTPPSITFLQPPSMEPPVPPGPDNVVSASNLSCTVINEGCFHWQWTPPPGITISQMWVADGTRTSIVQISQISAANAGDYTCRASFNGQSANTSIALQFIRKLAIIELVDSISYHKHIIT